MCIVRTKLKNDSIVGNSHTSSDSRELEHVQGKFLPYITAVSLRIIFRAVVIMFWIM
jgi:hypothetical protein